MLPAPPTAKAPGRATPEELLPGAEPPGALELEPYEVLPPEALNALALEAPPSEALKGGTPKANPGRKELSGPKPSEPAPPKSELS